MYASVLPSERSKPDDLWAVVFHPWPDQPIFHALRGRTTLCGREVGLYTPLLPMKHVRKFGRPCRSCWPRA